MNATAPYCREGGLTSLATNKLVTAELNYSGYKWGMLRARTPKARVGKWEKFRICTYRDEQGEFLYQTLYSVAAQHYVSAEYDYPGADRAMLRARSSKVGPWEKFELACLNGRTKCTLWAIHNKIMVSAERALYGHSGVEASAPPACPAVSSTRNADTCGENV